jgi:hypothetical protein
VDTAGCILQGDVRTKVKTPGTGKIMVEESLQTPLFPVQNSCLVFNSGGLSCAW